MTSIFSTTKSYRQRLKNSGVWGESSSTKRKLSTTTQFPFSEIKETAKLSTINK